jgi:2-phospho-L-lactate guanylyltransferase (CobY/MobA/RfbA family)
MAIYVIPYRKGGKTRLGDADLAQAMMCDVVDACNAAGADNVLIARAGGGQGAAIADVLAGRRGPVTIVNADVPCATADELRELTAAAPALVAAADGTTNALALRDATQFVPLYGPGSAARYAATLGARRLELHRLANDIDTWSDVERMRESVGTHTRRYLGSLVGV